MSEPNTLEEALGSIMNPLSTMLEQGGAEMVVGESQGRFLDDMIKDRIYGLLSQDSLTGPQIELLGALLQTIQIKLR